MSDSLNILILEFCIKLLISNSKCDCDELICVSLLNIYSTIELLIFLKFFVYTDEHEITIRY